jgi:hypothetical protein
MFYLVQAALPQGYIPKYCRWYCHCEERSDEAISFGQVRRLLRSLRSLAMTDCAAFTDGSGIYPPQPSWPGGHPVRSIKRGWLFAYHRSRSCGGHHGGGALGFVGMVHGRSKHLDNFLSLPPDRQIRRCLAMFYGVGSGDPARAMTILRYPVNHADLFKNNSALFTRSICLPESPFIHI